MKQPLLQISLFILLCFFCSFPSLFSQTSIYSCSEIVKSLKDEKGFSLIEISQIPSQELQLFLENYSGFLNEEDDLATRLNSYRFLYLVGLKHQNLSESVIYNLVFYGLSDNNAGNRKSVCSFLDSFQSDKFSVAAKNQMASYAINQTTPFKEISFLSARLELTDLAPHFKHLLLQGDLSTSRKWNLNIVLGRLGDQNSVEWCLNQVQNIGMNDLVVYKLVPDLVFTRHKSAMDFLLNAILEDQKNCSSPNPDSESKINCAYRLMEMLAPVILEFPVKVDESGQIVSDDYPEALNIVRDWIEQTNMNYTLLTN